MSVVTSYTGGNQYALLFLQQVLIVMEQSPRFLVTVDQDANVTSLRSGDQSVFVGMATSRGQLMSSIIFPAPMVFKYDEELPIVIGLMVLYAIPCAVCTIAFQYHNGSYSQWVTKFVYCMGVVNQCLNPLLPVVLTVGDVQAVRRLKVRISIIPHFIK